MIGLAEYDLKSKKPYDVPDHQIDHKTNHSSRSLSYQGQ